MGFRILNFNIFGVFQKTEYFWGYEDFVHIFLGSSQNWTIFRGHFYAFKGQVPDIPTEDHQLVKFYGLSTSVITVVELM